MELVAYVLAVGFMGIGFLIFVFDIILIQAIRNERRRIDTLQRQGRMQS